MIVFGIITAVIGLLLTIGFILSRIKCSEAVEAEVSKLNEKKLYLRGSTIKQFNPVFTYSVGGKDYTQKSDILTTNAKKYFVGQKLTVLVNPKNPSEMRYGSNIGILLTGIVLLLIGALFITLTFM